MAHAIVKTEHSGAKHGKGAWMRKAEAKHQSNRARRANDRRESARYTTGEPSNRYHTGY